METGDGVPNLNPLGLKPIRDDLNEIEDGELSTLDSDLQAKIIYDNLKILLINPTLRQMMGETKWKRFSNDHGALKVEMDKRIRMVIAVKGETGCGKSTLINALLGMDIAPTSSTSACTSCITEFSWNYESEYPRCEIEFLSKQEWLAQIKVFKAEDIASEIGSDAILKAVYPDFYERSTDWNRFSDEELLNAGDIAQYLGTNTIIQSDDVLIDHLVEDMAEIIAPQSVGMIDSQEFWPIVKLVKVYLRSDILSTGAVIVDLPGVGDINPARTRIAGAYELKADHLVGILYVSPRCHKLIPAHSKFIAAPQARAADGRGFALLEESLALQLKTLRKLSNLTFIATQSDIFNEKDIVSASPNIHTEYNTLSTKIAALETTETASSLDNRDEMRKIKEANRSIRIGRKKIRRIDQLQSEIAGFGQNSMDEKDETEEESSSEGDSSDDNSFDDNILVMPKFSSRKGQIGFGFVKTEEPEEDMKEAYSSGSIALPEELVIAYSSYSEMGSQELDKARKKVEVQLKEISRKKRGSEKLISRIQKLRKARKSEISIIQNTKYQLCSHERNRITRIGFMKSLKASLNGSFDQADRQQQNSFSGRASDGRDELVVPVFCTSSKEFNLRPLNSMNASGITSLRGYVKSLTTIPQYRLSATILNSALALISLIHNITGGKIQCVGGIQGLLELETPQLKGALQTSIARTKSQWTRLALPLQTQISQAATEGAELCRKGSNSFVNQPYQTLKAICLHNGDFTNRRRKTFNLNRSLMLPVRRSISDDWRTLFSNKEVQQQYEIRVINSFESTIRNLRTEVNSENLCDFNSFADEIMLQIKHILQQSLANLAITTADQEVDALSVLETSVQLSLKETYITCSLEKGTGSVVRMRSALAKFFETKKVTIFENASSLLKSKSDSYRMQQSLAELLSNRNIIDIQESIAAVLSTTSEKCLALFVEDFSYTAPTALADFSFTSQLSFKVAVEAERSKIQLLVIKLGGVPVLDLFGVDEDIDFDQNTNQSASRKRKADNGSIEKSAKAKGKEKAAIQ